MDGKRDACGCCCSSEGVYTGIYTAGTIVVMTLAIERGRWSWRIGEPWFSYLFKRARIARMLKPGFNSFFTQVRSKFFGREMRRERSKIFLVKRQGLRPVRTVLRISRRWIFLPFHRWVLANESIDDDCRGMYIGGPQVPEVRRKISYRVGIRQIFVSIQYSVEWARLLAKAVAA